jgi:hypothetical protein
MAPAEPPISKSDFLVNNPGYLEVLFKASKALTK